LVTTNSVSNSHEKWGVYASQSHRLHDPAFREEVLAFARMRFAHAVANIERLTEVLAREGYRFAEPQRVYTPPEAATQEWIQEIEHKRVYLPISLQAWMLEVGSVNLMGSHPAWPKTGYAFDNETSDVIYADPLVVEASQSYVQYLHDEWLAAIEEYGVEDAGPFTVDFAPDYIHKANISGGAPYAVQAVAPAVDALVLNERGCVSFMRHIREAFWWAGFPGFAYQGEPVVGFVARLRVGLEVM
jgi:hypothetical protein